MIIRIIIYGFLALFTYFASVKYSIKFKYEDYKDYLTLISGVSGMVFTIMGIWIAFLYPNAISRIADPKKIVAADFSESQSDSKRLESIVGAIFASAIVMIAALLITFFKILFFLTPVYVEYRAQIKSIALAALVLMTLTQLDSVFKVVISNIMFINDLHFKRQARRSEDEG